ncbi:MAG: hypothetical protein JNM11_06120, partial [Chitinimonas sp.]|nr:hypothetical protein [Chitinimonas sp.]
GERLVNPENLRMLLFGIALIFVMLVRPEGLWPSKQRKAEFHEDDDPAKGAEKEAAHG